jgi:TPP-dependent pyruvate/acetoin dehydrogenase alpha subunit
MVMDLSAELQVEMYRRMLRVRRFEEKAVELVALGEIPGSVHTSQGQEAEIVGACMALRVDDYMTGNHRSHGHPIGKGAALKPLFAELMGRRTGVCKGKGGSMHLADFSVGSLGESGIVGSGLPVATGAGLSARLRGTDQVSLCFFGDGASSQGTFHESLNLAAIWKLPVIFLCENNRYAVTTPAAYALSVEDVAARAAGYGIPGVVADGQDPIAVYEAVSQAVLRARAGDGPSLVEAKTYRYLEHAAQLPVVRYRTPEEIEEWKRERDPIRNFRHRLVAEGVLSEPVAAEIEAGVRQEIDDAVAFARQSPLPAPAEAFEDLFARPIPLRGS